MKEFDFNEKNKNTCYYSEGDKHKTCTHPYYCIFNDYRNQLESDITTIENKYNSLTNQLKNIQKGDIHTEKDYEELLKDIENIEQEYIDLTDFRNNILEEKVKSYGYLEV